MRKFIFCALLAFPLIAIAQDDNVWAPQEEGTPFNQKVNNKKPQTDEKYLKGAVPVEDGKVTWDIDIELAGMTDKEIYNRAYKLIYQLTKSEGQFDESAIVLIDREKHVVVANLKEWLIFSQHLLAVDRTAFRYTLIATCTEGNLHLTLCCNDYTYGEGRREEKYKAEEWITDEYAMNKAGTKLYGNTAKFRRKTIDRKDHIFSTMAKLMKEKD